ncbi:hypothetical protein PybrP1_000603, partial [[Pythium] brassicae (nom. inval.)]
ELAAVSGRLDAVQWACARTELTADVFGRALAAAADRGHLAIVRWLHARQKSSEGEAFAAAAAGLTGTHAGCRALGAAITNGHLDVVRFLVDSGYQLDETERRRLSRSARRGDLELLQYLHANELTRDVAGWIDNAAAGGHLRVVEWAYKTFPSGSGSRGASRRCNAMDNAARGGHLEVVQWLHASHWASECSAFAMDRAAENGHLDVVRWLHEHRSEGSTTRGMDTAASGGHLHVVRWLQAHRSEGCTTLAMDAAAASGHLAVVQWLHDHRSEGCSTAAMDGAATSGHLDVVRWLHNTRTEGCTTAAMDGAAMNGHLEVVKWLHVHRTEGCSRAAMNMAAANGHIDVVKWLHANRSEGCSTNAMDGANSLDVLQWLHDHRTEGCTRVAVVDAARVGNIEKLLFLREKRIEVVSDRAAGVALRGGSFEIFQWLQANYPHRVEREAVDLVSTGRSGALALFLQLESARSSAEAGVATG